MHMADALVSPQVGGVMLGIAGGILAYSVNFIKKHFDESKIPLMGILGAFVFAAQMVNFAIPGTGSSGHISGAVLLAILLGPAAGFMVLSCILLIQALFFADGGLLALGCNIFNMGFWGCFLAAPLVYRPIVRRFNSDFGMMTGAIAAGIVALQFGAFSVVMETLCSKVTELPFDKFVLLMQPIHLAIGAIEGMLTGALLIFLKRGNAGFVAENCEGQGKLSMKYIMAILLIGALFTGGGLSLLASGNPDGLEWSIGKTAVNEPENSSAIHQRADEIQRKSAILPDYNFKSANYPQLGTISSGLTGTLLVLALATFTGWLFRRKKVKKVEVK